MRDDDGADKRDVAQPHARKPYVKPAIREYGSIAKLTQSGGSTKPESGRPLRSGICL